MPFLFFRHFAISIHTLREEGDVGYLLVDHHEIAISIHALREEGDADVVKQRVDFFISIHALREEGDKGAVPHRHGHRYFYPRPPRGGRQLWFVVHCQGSLFLSTPSARRATRGLAGVETRSDISIHALREEGDQISSAAPKAVSQFLSTPSARRATA